MHTKAPPWKCKITFSILCFKFYFAGDYKIIFGSKSPIFWLDLVLLLAEQHGIHAATLLLFSLG